MLDVKQLSKIIFVETSDMVNQSSTSEVRDEKEDGGDAAAFNKNFPFSRIGCSGGESMQVSKIFSIFLVTTKLNVMPATSHRASSFLIFPWGLMSIVLVLGLNLTLNNVWFSKNWSWIALVLIIPAAILENFKVGYSTMRIMFMKVLYSLISFLLVGMAFGSALTGWHIEKFQNVTGIKSISLPWYVLLALMVLLLIQVAQLFSMLKAVKREFMQLDPDE